MYLKKYSFSFDMIYIYNFMYNSDRGHSCKLLGIVGSCIIIPDNIDTGTMYTSCRGTSPGVTETVDSHCRYIS